MDRENLKAWVHFALLNPVDEHHLAHAQATKELLDNNEAKQKAIDKLLEYQITIEQKNARYREALELIAMPMRSDGTYNRDRKSCEELARKALKGE